MANTDRWRQEGLRVVSARGVIAHIPAPQNGGTFDCMENGALMAAAPDLLALVEAVEWVNDESSLHRYCPWCGNYEDYGHDIKCPRQHALAKARGQDEEQGAGEEE